MKKVDKKFKKETIVTKAKAEVFPIFLWVYQWHKTWCLLL